MTRLLFSLASLLTLASLAFGANAATPDDETIIVHLLHGYATHGKYTVVSPMTVQQTLSTESRKYVKDHLQADGTDVGALLDKLVERNKVPVRLALVSAPRQGYVVDYDNRYINYFKKNRGGWEKWYKDHPKAHGLTSVSLPVYDEKAGMALIYIGTQSHWRSGEGALVLLKFDHDAITEVGRVVLWVS